MIIIKALWGLIINLDLIVISILILNCVFLFWGKHCRINSKITFLSGILLIFILGDWPYSGRDLVRRLENHFPAINTIPKDTHGIIVLGGSYSLFESEVTGKPIYHKTSGRLIEALNIAKAYQHLHIVFIGSNLETTFCKQLMLQQGITEERLHIQSNIQSNSLEDAAHEISKKITDKHKKWLVITSAYNLPRAIQVLTYEKWNCIPYSTDYHTIGHPFDKKHPSFISRLFVSYMDRLGTLSWNIAWREIAGLINLRLSGKTTSIMPS